MKNGINDGIINDLPELDNLTKKVNMAYTIMGVSSDGKSVIYKRDDCTSSQLGIQVGEEDTINDYVLFVRKSTGSKKAISRNTVYMHIDSKISENGQMLANLIGGDVSDFFESVEKNYQGEYSNYKFQIKKEIKKKNILSKIKSIFK